MRSLFSSQAFCARYERYIYVAIATWPSLFKVSLTQERLILINLLSHLHKGKSETTILLAVRSI
jgi:hypothetical protein